VSYFATSFSKMFHSSTVPCSWRDFFIRRKTQKPGYRPNSTHSHVEDTERNTFITRFRMCANIDDPGICQDTEDTERNTFITKFRMCVKHWWLGNLARYGWFSLIRGCSIPQWLTQDYLTNIGEYQLPRSLIFAFA
jgi:hypothetical protein